MTAASVRAADVLRAATTGAASALAAQSALLARPPGGAAPWTRTNHRGRPLSLVSGPALAAAVAMSADLPRAAAVVAAAGAGAVGRYDDVTGDRHPHAKGLRGHATALRSGRVTGGVVKVAGIGLTALVAARLAGASRGRDLLVDGAVVAMSANLLNLLDLRPGRALKAGAIAAVALRQPGPAAAAAALLPEDLHERTMLGDSGANALGAVLGLGLLQRHAQRRGAAVTVLVGLTALSEVVSYSRVIDAVPPLRWLDGVGRLDRAGRLP